MPPSTEQFDIAVIGGGIVGLATAMALSESASVIVLEAEAALATHQTGHNSGVIHSGLYYKPGSLKATLCAAGRDAMYEFCARHNVPHDRCGKIVVATDPSEIPRLDELERRGRANGLQDIRRLTPSQIRDLEPAGAGIDGLHVPITGIVDFPAAARAMAAVVCTRGGQVRTGAPLMHVHRTSGTGGGFVLDTPLGEIGARSLVNCAGLQCDRVAMLCGSDPGVRIVPFRGEYYDLKPHAVGLVKNLIYPVPDPRFPFLGVHFTRMIHGGVEAGPNAVLALARHGYGWQDVSLQDTARMLAFPGFWKMSMAQWRTGMMELRRSWSKRRFVADLRRLIPVLTTDDVVAARSGVRAQAVDANGKLLDDFHVVTGDRMVHVLNAPSPAATASIAIGRSIADTARKAFALPRIAEPSLI
ncbi:MAG: L-2-hydroxyglutarate oxidase [Phycisphaeraceae bacterium]|nr:L-2-hydroxyglutarate oxidase [Phycisphaeraceae bacterium]